MAVVTDAYEYWCNAARDLIDGALPYACLDAAGFRFPGRTGPNGLRVDQLEGFARVGLLMAFYVRSQDDRCAEEYRHFLRAGFAAGVGTSETRWPSTKTNRQVLVEAATISLILRLTRRQVWSTLDSSTQEALLDWMQQALGTLRIPENNWHLFRALIASALVELGGRLEFAVMRKAEFSYIDKWYVASGWYSDGGERKYDHYNAFALHFYPTLDAWLRDDHELLAVYRDRLTAFLRSYIHWFGADGPHVALGRSLIYRFGSTAALGLAGLVGTDLDAALIQSRATSSLRYFLTHGALTEGVLSLGWTGADPSVVQGYSGPASPYWASKAFIALLIPRTDAFWSSPLTLSAAKPPPPTPLLVQSVSDDLVVLHNHGSHDYEQVSGNTLPDSAYYSRFAYSSRTLPDAGETGILTTGVSLDGCRRSAFRGRIVDAAAGEGWASSRSVLRLLEPALPAQLGHRSGDRVYAHLPAQLQRLRDTDGHLDGLTMIGDGLAIQVVRVRSAPLSGRLRIGGWPIAMPAETIARQSSIMITGSFKDGGNGSSSMRAYLGAFGRPALATTSSGSGFPVLVSKSVRRNDDIMLVYGMALRADHGQIAWPDVRFASSLLTVAFSTHETSVLVCAGPLHVER